MNVKQLKIVLAPLQDSKELSENGYLCLNVIGLMKGVYKDNPPPHLNRVSYVNAWSYRHDYEGRDFTSASNGYMHNLETYKNRVFNKLKKLLTDNDPDKIAIIGIENPIDGYCFRYLFYTFLVRHMYFYLPDYRVTDLKIQNGISMDEFWKIAYTDIYWKHREVNITIEEAEKVLSENEFRFAKTMPTNPHWYTLRKTWKDWNKFADIINLIRVKGTPIIAMNTMWRSLEIGDYVYWHLSCYDVAEDTDLLNRKPIKK